MKYFKRKYSMIEKYRQANSISPGSKVREEEKKVVNPVRSMFWFYLIIIKKKSITLSCTQILILHKLFPPRVSISYLLETCHSYKFQCQFLTNKSAFYSMGLCSAWLKILWKLPQVFFCTRMGSLLNLAVLTSWLTTTYLLSYCLAAPLKWLPLSGCWND